jgi:DNA-entry nuclease
MLFILIFLIFLISFIIFDSHRIRSTRHRKKIFTRSVILFLLFFLGAGFAFPTECKSKVALNTHSSTSFIALNSKNAKEKKVKSKAKKKKKTKKKTKKKKAEQQKTAKQLNIQDAALAKLDYSGTQTIEVNGNLPTFSAEDLTITSGGWEKYGDLDQLNRATSAEALLNQSTMPKTGEKRGSIAKVKPTGWKNKKIKGGYLYNRSHLIGWALSAENDNWKNLITGTQQMNNPEMLRFEMDIKYYLEQSPDNYVRYSVTPIFRNQELVARGVHLMAQSVNSDAVKFNVYIFNIQDGATINYADGTSQIDPTTATSSAPPASAASTVQSVPAQPAEENQTASQAADSQTVFVTPTGEKYHSHAHGRGNFTPSTLGEAKQRGLSACSICY